MKLFPVAFLFICLISASSAAPIGYSVTEQIESCMEEAESSLDDEGPTDLNWLQWTVKKANDHVELEPFTSFSKESMENGIAEYISSFTGERFTDNDKSFMEFKRLFDDKLTGRCEKVIRIFKGSSLPDVVKNNSLLRGLDNEPLGWLTNVKLCMDILESPFSYCRAGFQSLV